MPRAAIRRKPVAAALLMGSLLLSACAGGSSTAGSSAATEATLAPSPGSPGTPLILTPSPSREPAPPTPSPTLDPEAWKQMPVVPRVSDTARRIYQRGLEMGNNPRAFSKVGDCQNVLSMFLAVYDHPGRYRLGEYAYLQETIDYFAGSWSRSSQAVRGGFNAASILSPFWADTSVCESGESPLACELRLHRPSFAIISLETWWEGDPHRYERYYRQIVEYTLSQGVVPILATKADNLEGDWRINAAVGRIAYEYDVPLWNFWAAVQPLPGHGLLSDGFHLTFDLNYFDEPARMRAAWPWRNLTALQALDAVRRAVAAAEPGPTPSEVP